jgi:predicted kinase
MRKKAINFINKTFLHKNDRKSNLFINSPIFENIFQSIKHHFLQNIRPKPILIRLAGLSGSGKSSQLLPASEEFYKTLKINPVNLAVRKFAEFHPNYNQIKKEYGIKTRSRTNGFALSLLFRTCEEAIKNKMPILWDMTLLDPEFEKHFLNLAKQHNYIIEYHILTTSKLLADLGIERRKELALTTQKTKEKPRSVSKKSSRYFAKALPKALKVIKKSKLLTPKDKFYYWDINKAKPLNTSQNLQNYRLFKEIMNLPLTQKSKEELKNDISYLIQLKEMRNAPTQEIIRIKEIARKLKLTLFPHTPPTHFKKSEKEIKHQLSKKKKWFKEHAQNFSKK